MMYLIECIEKFTINYFFYVKTTYNTVLMAIHVDFEAYTVFKLEIETVKYFLDQREKKMRQIYVSF